MKSLICRYAGIPIALAMPAMLALSTTSCSEEEEPLAPQLVIEGQIESGSLAQVLLTWSLTPDENSEIGDKIITWGKITLSDGTHEEILRGGKTTGWLPPYRYYGNEIRGEAGKEYEIRAEYKGQVATSKVRMPERTAIDSITVSAIEGVDSLRSVVMHFTAPSDCPAYYYLSIREMGSREQPLPCFMGIVSTDTPGSHIRVGVFNAKKYTEKHYVSNLRRGYDYEISLNRVTEKVFRFRQVYNEMLAFSHNPFLSTAQTLPTNIDGGLGIWSAQGTEKYELKLR